MNRNASYIFLNGSNYEVGKILGEFYTNNLSSLDAVQINEPYISKEHEHEMYRLFDKFCPGINEEIQGFAEVLGIPPAQILYYAETYLTPGCSQMAILPTISANGHTLLARNYDFRDGIEEMSITNTKIKGRYSHISSSAWIFGRGDGINEQGLAVSQSSVGIPVTRNIPNTSRTAITGLQFWAVIRSVLENCSSVDEAIEWAKEIPIAFNMNMMTADKSGKAALIETVNGRKAVKRIDSGAAEQYLSATNHAHLPSLLSYAPMGLKNSLNRNSIIKNCLSGKVSITTEDLRQLLSEQYPIGLNCRYYDYYFGTIRSQIIDLDEGAMLVRWGTSEVNDWLEYRIDDAPVIRSIPVQLIKEIAPDDFYDMISIR